MRELPNKRLLLLDTRCCGKLIRALESPPNAYLTLGLLERDGERRGGGGGGGGQVAVAV